MGWEREPENLKGIFCCFFFFFLPYILWRQEDKKLYLKSKQVPGSLMNTSVLAENAIRSMLTADDGQPSWVFILNISLPVSPLAAPHFLLLLGFPTRWGESSLLTRMGELMLTPTATVQSTPSLLFLLPKLPAASGENLGHGVLQISGPLTNTSLSWRSWLSRARLSLPAPSWVTCFHSSTISLMSCFTKRRMKSSVRGLDQSNPYALRHRVRLQVRMCSWTRQDPVESTSPPPSCFSFLLVMTDL